MLRKLKEVLAEKAEKISQVEGSICEKNDAPEKPTMTMDECVDRVLKDAQSGFTKPKTERVQILGDYQNPMWKKGRTNGGLGEGCKVWVPRRFSDRLRHKVIDCQRVDENGETYYKYLP